ncbi:MAG: crossover junction endodeoxyribonuclease RuvC [Spirochaetes bacterium]|nr:crossover junction endodeoxyribonuclease RuvC [Spirochaetota bacterium]MBU1079589.1 crossover junction endodeoxyribonuclease RuvC [Spirochaetota bacterium]
MRVLGIDPGLAAVGWGVVDIDGARIVYRGHGCFTTKAGDDVAERLAHIRSSLAAVIAEYAPAEAAMESLFFSRNVSSALGVAEARGVIRLACRDAGLAMSEYGPMDVKKAATGSGRSGKEDVQAFVRLVLGLTAVPKPDHAADALAVALCHSQGRAVRSALVDTSRSSRL